MRLLAPISLAALVSIGSAQSLDPIATRNHRALSLAFLRLSPRVDLLEPKQSEWSLGWTEANDLRRSDKPTGGQLFEDYEVSRLSVSWRRGLSPGTEVGIELPLMSRGGGSMDPIIDWWHQHILGWTNPLRDATPKGQCTIDFPDGKHFGSASGIGDVSAYYARSLGRGATLKLAAKLPTGDASHLLGSGGLDLGASVQAARKIAGKWAFGGQAGLVFQGKAAKLDGTRTLADQEALWLMWLPNSRDSWILQWQSEASPLRSGIPSSDAAHRLITLGLRRRLSESSRLEAYFSEDRDLPEGKAPEIANIGPDFTIGLMLTIRR